MKIKIDLVESILVVLLAISFSFIFLLYTQFKHIIEYRIGYSPIKQVERVHMALNYFRMNFLSKDLLQLNPTNLCFDYNLCQFANEILFSKMTNKNLPGSIQNLEEYYGVLYSTKDQEYYKGVR